MGGQGNLLKNRILDIVCLFFGCLHERIECPELFSMKMKMASFFDSANICVLLGLLTPMVGHYILLKIRILDLNLPFLEIPDKLRTPYL